jgi:hypothetical protein
MLKYKSEQKSATVSDMIPKASTQISTSSQGLSRWSRMTWFEKSVAVFNLFTQFFCSLVLIGFALFGPSGAASFRDVAFIGLLSAVMVISSRRYDT